MASQLEWPPVVDRATWNDARSVLLQQEKALTRMKDAVSAARRRMPMVEVRPDYGSIGSAGAVALLDLFDGEERQSLRVFLRRGDRVFHTWSAQARGEEPFMVVFDLRDLTPFGRQETWENSPAGTPQEPAYSWMRLSDRYAAPEHPETHR